MRRRWWTRFSGLLLLLAWIEVAANEVDWLEFNLPSGQSIEVQRFGGAGESILLWLPSERGFGKSHVTQAKALAGLGHEVWLADLHDAYFIETNRASIARFPLEDLVSLIEAASDGDRPVLLMSASRGAQLALIAAREWQLRNPGNTSLKGLFLMHAYLYQARPRVGEIASYLPIAGATNLPVYLLEAQFSTKSARLRELVEVLEAGGSQVYSQLLPGVQAGFHVRDENDLGTADRQARVEFAALVDRALAAIASSRTPRTAAFSLLDTRQFSRASRFEPVLTALEKPIAAPKLQLDGFRQKGFQLARQSGRVVLVNFWASWCRPCVEEIPSLHRLADKLPDPEFEIVTVNVGEDRNRIKSFLDRVPMRLPILLDVESRAVRDWRIYVYPSSYLVDRRGKIRYAYLGALQWDSPENIKIIEKLLRQP